MFIKTIPTQRLFLKITYTFLNFLLQFNFLKINFLIHQNFYRQSYFGALWEPKVKLVLFFPPNHQSLSQLMVYIKHIEGYKIMRWCLDFYFTFHMSDETCIIFSNLKVRLLKGLYAFILKFVMKNLRYQVLRLLSLKPCDGISPFTLELLLVFRHFFL